MIKQIGEIKWEEGVVDRHNSQPNSSAASPHQLWPSLPSSLLIGQRPQLALLPGQPW